MVKAKHSLCKSKRNDNIKNNDKKTTKTKKKRFELFSESEIDVAEQLIQLSGDSSDAKNIYNHEDISDSDTTHLMIDITSNRIKDNFFDEEDDGFDPRRKKRFKSLSEICSLTNKPLF